MADTETTATPPPTGVVVNSTTRRKVEALYSNDNWIKRRRLIYIKIYGQLLVAGIIVLACLIAAIYRAAVNVDIINTLLTIVVPALLAAAAVDMGNYIYGGNADDKDKRANLPTPAPVASPTPPADFVPTE